MNSSLESPPTHGPEDYSGPRLVDENYNRQIGQRSFDDGGAITGGDGGSGMGPEERLAKLETHIEYTRRDLDEIKADQKEVKQLLSSLDRKLDERLSQLPTKSDLWSWKLHWAAIAVAAIALIVGGIIGGLSWIKPEVTPIYVQPVQIESPASN